MKEPKRKVVQSKEQRRYSRKKMLSQVDGVIELEEAREHLKGENERFLDMVDAYAPIPPEGEWHRTKENMQIIRRICRKVYGDGAAVGEGHHIAVCKGCDGSTIKEWASVETLIFDHLVLQQVFGAGKWEDALIGLAQAEPQERLKRFDRYLNLILPLEELVERKRNEKAKKDL